MKKVVNTITMRYEVKPEHSVLPDAGVVEISTESNKGTYRNIVCLSADTDLMGTTEAMQYGNKPTGLNYTLTAVKFAMLSILWGATNLFPSVIKSAKVKLGGTNLNLLLHKLGDSANEVVTDKLDVFEKNRRNLIILDAMNTGVDAYTITPVNKLSKKEAIACVTDKASDNKLMASFLRQLLKLELPTCRFVQTDSGFALIDKRTGKAVDEDSLTNAEYVLFVLLEYFTLKQVTAAHAWCVLYWDCQGLPREVVDTFLLTFTEQFNVSIFLYNYDKTKVCSVEDLVQRRSENLGLPSDDLGVQAGAEEEYKRYKRVSTLVERAVKRYDLPAISEHRVLADLGTPM